MVAFCFWRCYPLDKLLTTYYNMIQCDHMMQPIDRANEIRAQLRAGAITYEESRRRLIPIFAEMNERGREIAKRHGIRHRPLNAQSFLR